MTRIEEKQNRSKKNVNTVYSVCLQYSGKVPKERALSKKEKVDDSSGSITV